MPASESRLAPDQCVFCAIVAGQAPAEVVYEDEHTLAFMDINPAVRGHVLVVPKRHARDIFDVSEEDAGQVMRTVVRVARAVEKALQPDGLNLIQANRRAAMQSVFHFHMHVVPRWWDDGLRPIWRHQRGDPEVLRQTAETIRQALA
jgi:histidine triad (HIT) family protein